MHHRSSPQYIHDIGNQITEKCSCITWEVQLGFVPKLSDFVWSHKLANCAVTGHTVTYIQPTSQQIVQEVFKAKC